MRIVELAGEEEVAEAEVVEEARSPPRYGICLLSHYLSFILKSDVHNCSGSVQALESDEEEMPMPSGEETVEDSDEQIVVKQEQEQQQC